MGFLSVKRLRTAFPITVRCVILCFELSEPWGEITCRLARFAFERLKLAESMAEKAKLFEDIL